MSDKNRPRRFFLVLAALLLPAATCGLAPSLPELLRRIQLVESRTARLEQFAANAQLPLVLMDDHNFVVGTVLEYNDMYKYASVTTHERVYYEGPPVDWYHPWSPPENFALATIVYSLPGRPPLTLEANREVLLTPKNGNGVTLYFESENCTGRPWDRWLGEEGNTGFSLGWIGPPGRTLYALAPGTPAQRVSSGSMLVANGVVGETQRCSRRQAETLMRPFEPVMDLSVYAPPFRIVDQRELFGF